MSKLTINAERSMKINKWKVKEGTYVTNGQILFLYTTTKTCESSKFKSNKAGKIHALKVKEGDCCEIGECLIELEACAHNTVMKDLCAECGADLHKDNVVNTSAPAIVPMVHSVPELKVTEELAKKLGQADQERLLKDRKLVLLVDLDQTIVHTTNEDVAPNIKDVKHYQLSGPWGSRWYHTRLRPGTDKFLVQSTELFELHVCTFGARQYAHAVSQLLDPTGKIFSHRILSRDECFDPTTKAANLKALFPCGDKMVCIIDDREDVWRHASNLIHVRPYVFFKNTGDINAFGLPPQVIKEKEECVKPDEKSDLNLPEIIENNDESSLSKEATECAVVEKENGRTSEREEKNETETKENDSDKKVDDKSAENDQSSDRIEQDDPDDYLLYLGDILKRIHRQFYTIYDKTNEVPDLKVVIPDVKRDVLNGTSLVFSGLVPTDQNLSKSRAYLVAKSLGADVTAEITKETTHLVAIHSGTAKVKNARRMNNGIHIVSTNWLWSCAERWERVDERLFPLQKSGFSGQRHPPAHCSSPPHAVTQNSFFIDTINPLLTFSSDDIANMDREVEDIFNESGESDSESVPEDKEDNAEATLTGFETTQADEEQSMEAGFDGDDDTSDTNDSGKDTNQSSQPIKSRKRRISTEIVFDDDSWSRMGADLERQLLD